MANDYGKKTNAELVEILKSRSLPHTGKKADLVARLQQDDESKASAAAAAPAEDVIDWDDEVTAESAAAAKPATEAGATAIAAGGKGAVSNPLAVPNQKLDEDPAKTDDLKVESTGAAAEGGAAPAQPAEAKPAVDFTRGLPASELEEEMKKRQARAAKFGIVEDTETALKEAEKQLQRAKRFGTGTGAEPTAPVGVKGLDEALPDERSRKRSRNDQDGRGGKRRDMGGRNRNRQRGGGDGNRNRNDGGNNKSGQQKSWSEKDSLAMEGRKKRFATAA